MLDSRTKNSTTTESLLNSIIDSAFFAIMAFRSVRDENNKIIDFEWIFANKVASEIVAYQVSELMGSRLLDLFPGNLETGLFDKYKNVVETGEFASFIQKYDADNLNTWFQISASKLGDGLTVTFQDISDQKRTEAEVETKGNKYQKLFDESIDAIYLLDDKFNFLNINRSLRELFKLSLEELIGTSIKQLFWSDGEFELFENALKKQNKIEELEVYLRTKNNEKKFCLVNCVPLYDEEKQQQNYLGVIRDNTRRKQAEKELLAAEKLSMTGKIARTIAHEIRNPLTNITLALEQLKDVTQQIEDADIYLNIISRGSNRIGKLINDLLNSSKPKALNLVNQPIRNLISEALTLVKDRMNLKSMRLVESYPEKVVKVPIDSDQFKIALLNLFINAIEAMKPHEGILEIRVRFLENNYVELVIKDNGKGISQENISQMFEPFFTGKQEGSGLGLMTVQNIIHSHNGKIQVESEIGKGTEFILLLPMNNVE
jgi:PAS domain S-box-containing protein